VARSGIFLAAVIAVERLTEFGVRPVTPAGELMSPMCVAPSADSGAVGGGWAARWAKFLWGSPLLGLRFSLVAALVLWWLWRNRCCET
jgi:hypothetical protein